MPKAPKKVTQKEPLESVVRRALDIMPPCEARVILARAMNARMTFASVGKVYKSIGQCALCSEGITANQPYETNAYTGRKLKSALVHSGCFKTYQNDIRLVHQRFDQKRVSFFNADKMDKCACGHYSSSHTSDKLENLLACKEPKCSCRNENDRNYT